MRNGAAEAGLSGQERRRNNRQSRLIGGLFGRTDRSATKGKTMYASVRTYTNTQNLAEAASLIKTDLLPRLKDIPGFRAYYAVDCGGGIVLSVSLYDKKKEAEASNKTA